MCSARLLQSLEASVPRCDDGIGIGPPDEWFGVGIVMLGNVPIDGRLKIRNRAEDTVLQSPSSEGGEKPFNGVEPGR